MGIAIRIVWRASIRTNQPESTPHTDLPVIATEPFGQDSESPLDVVQTGEEGL